MDDASLKTHATSMAGAIAEWLAARRDVVKWTSTELWQDNPERGAAVRDRAAAAERAAMVALHAYADAGGEVEDNRD